MAELIFAKQINKIHPQAKAGSFLLFFIVRETIDNIIVRCEVCDVDSSNAGHNGKEKSDLKNLGCETVVPKDQIRRFIATSEKFSDALSKETRKWQDKHYRFRKSGEYDKTVLLEIVSPE